MPPKFQVRDEDIAYFLSRIVIPGIILLALLGVVFGLGILNQFKFF